MIKGIRIENGPRYWHVCVKRSDNNQGYVELDKFLTFEAAADFAKKYMLECTK